jgi:hypothetical protein
MSAATDGLADHGPDRTRASVALRRAAEPPIDFTGRSRPVARLDDRADFALTQNVAGADNHFLLSGAFGIDDSAAPQIRL